MGYWKYRVDGVEYFVPNMGFLLLVDSNFKEVKDDGVLPKTKRNYNMYFDAIYGVRKYNRDNLRKKIAKNLKDMLNINNFGPVHQKNYVNNLPENIKTLWKSICADTETDIEILLIRYMSKFLHNRVGTFLKKTEKEFVRSNPSRDFRKGDLIVYDKMGGGVKDYRWALYIKSNNDATSQILYKSAPDDKEFKEEKVNNIIERQSYIG